MNIETYTKNQAASILRQATSPEQAYPFLNHSNSNVQRYAKFALEYRLKAPLASRLEVPSGGVPVEIKEPEVVREASVAKSNVGFGTTDELALHYNLDLAVVEKVVSERTVDGTTDWKSVKRSLAARKARAAQSQK